MSNIYPLGSVVTLKDGTQKVMIIGRGVVTNGDEGKEFFDYVACLYPAGIFNDQMIYFNQENIDHCFFKGFSDEEEAAFDEVYPSLVAKLPEDVKRGEV